MSRLIPESMEINHKIDVNTEKIKTHLRENKDRYILGGIVAGFTCLVMRGRHAGIPRVPDGLDTVTVRPLSFFSKQNVVTVVQRNGAGHPGYITRCIETGLEYATQGDAARAMGIYPSVLSGHITGKLPDANGFHFERVAPQTA